VTNTFKNIKKVPCGLLKD